MTKPRVRLFSDGKFVRFWQGGFGAWFPTGPYETLEEALSWTDFYAASSACGKTERKK